MYENVLCLDKMLYWWLLYFLVSFIKVKYRNYTGAPRHCPGYSIAINIVPEIVKFATNHLRDSTVKVSCNDYILIAKWCILSICKTLQYKHVSSKDAPRKSLFAKRFLHLLFNK